MTSTNEHTTYGVYLIAEQATIETDLIALNTSVIEHIEKNNGTVVHKPLFQKQKLAYPIKKTLYAYTTSLFFTAPQEHIAPIQEALRSIQRPLIRFLITKERMPEVPQEQNAPTEKKATLKNIDKKIDEIMDTI